MHLGLLFLVLAAAPHARSTSFTGRVVEVADGDTLTVLRSGRGVKIRLAEVDCPEKGQAFGMKAKEFTSKSVFGEDVRVEVTARDRYGRLVAHVYDSDGRSLNRALLEAGFAWFYVQYAKDPELGAIEREARRLRRGLWIERAPVPPWDFRKQPRSLRPVRH